MGYAEAGLTSGDGGFTPRPAMSGTPANVPERFAVIVPQLPSGDIWDRYAGDDHVGAPRRAYADATIYSWLLR